MKQIFLIALSLLVLASARANTVAQSTFAVSSTNPAGTLLENYAPQGSDIGTWSKDPSFSTGSMHLTSAGGITTTVTNITSLYLSSVAPPSANYSQSLNFTYLTSTNNLFGPTVRSSGNTYYQLERLSTAGTFQLVKVVGGTGTNIGTASSAVTLTASAGYTATVSANGTSIIGVVTRASDGEYLTSSGAWQAAYAFVCAATDSSITSPGVGGFDYYSVPAPSDTTGVIITGSSTVVPTTMTLSTVSALTGSTVAMTATGSNSGWTSGTTFSVSGGTGASISGLSTNVSTQVATFNLITGSSAGTLTISDSTDLVTATVAVVVPSYPKSTFAVSTANPAGTLLENYAPQGSDIGTWSKDPSFSTGSMHLTSAGALATTTTSTAVYLSSAITPTANYSYGVSFTYDSNLNNQLAALARAAGNTYYSFQYLSSAATFGLTKTVSGSGTPLGSTVSAPLTVGVGYTETISVNGTTVSGIVTRQSDGDYLTGGGTWQAAYAVAATASDSSITATGSGGMLLYSYAAPSDTTGLVVTAASAAALAPTFTLSPASAPASSSTTLAAIGSNTAWGSGTTFSVSGATGVSISALSVNASAQTATFTLTTGSATGTLTISDSTDSATSTFLVLGPVVNILPANLWENGYSNLVGPDANGISYYNCSAFARLVVSTDATSFSLVAYSNATTGKVGTVALRINGVDADTFSFSTQGNNTIPVTLTGYPSYVSGTNSLEIISGSQTSSGNANPGLLVWGTYLQTIQFAGGTFATIQTPSVAANRVVIYGTSIDVGADALNTAGNSAFGLLGWTNLLRNYRGGGSTLVEAYGSRNLHSDCSTPTLTTSFAAHMASFNAPFYWFAMGTNDYGLSTSGTWSAASFGTAYASLLDQLHAAVPSAIIICQTPLLRDVETANTYGNTLTDYRSQIVTICSTRSSFAKLVRGENILTLSNISDALVHPTTVGQYLLSNYNRGVLDGYALRLGFQ